MHFAPAVAGVGSAFIFMIMFLVIQSPEEPPSLLLQDIKFPPRFANRRFLITGVM